MLVVPAVVTVVVEHRIAQGARASFLEPRRARPVRAIAARAFRDVESWRLDPLAIADGAAGRPGQALALSEDEAATQTRRRLHLETSPCTAQGSLEVFEVVSNVFLGNAETGRQIARGRESIEELIAKRMTQGRSPAPLRSLLMHSVSLLVGLGGQHTDHNASRRIRQVTSGTIPGQVRGTAGPSGTTPGFPPRRGPHVVYAAHLP